MQAEIEQYKGRFLRTLDPFLNLLASKQIEINREEWSSLVQRLESNATLHSEQYLGKDVPNQAVTVTIVREILNDFIRHRISERVGGLKIITFQN